MFLPRRLESRNGPSLEDEPGLDGVIIIGISCSSFGSGLRGVTFIIMSSSTDYGYNRRLSSRVRPIIDVNAELPVADPLY